MGVEKCGEKNSLEVTFEILKTVRDWARCEPQALPGKQRLERGTGWKVGTRQDE